MRNAGIMSPTGSSGRDKRNRKAACECESFWRASVRPNLHIGLCLTSACIRAHRSRAKLLPVNMCPTFPTYCIRFICFVNLLYITFLTAFHTLCPPAFSTPSFQCPGSIFRRIFVITHTLYDLERLHLAR